MGGVVMKYAVQIRWPDGHWTYVMDTHGEKRVLHDTRHAAEVHRATWIRPGHEDAVRVVEMEDRDGLPPDPGVRHRAWWDE